MKKCLNLFLFLLISSLISAQSFFNDLNLSNEKQKEIYDLKNPSISLKKGVKIKQLDSLILEYNGSDTTFSGFARRDIFRYDSINNRTIEESYNKYGIGMPWEYGSRLENYYDTNDNLIERAYFEDWNSSNGTFDTRGRYVLSYNNNLLTEFVLSYWDSSSQTWIFDEKGIITYNTSGERLEIISQTNTNGQWEDASKWVYSYNTNNLVSLTELYYMTYGNWEIDSKTDYTYNMNNDLTQELTSEMFNGNWENDYKLDISYPVWGKVMENSDWDFSNWIVSNRLVQYIDAANNLANETYYQNDFATQTLVPSYSHNYVYDDAYPYAVLETTLTEEECRHQLLSYTHERANNNGVLEPYLGGTYYWTDLVSAVSEPLFTSSDSHSVFPNPASDKLTITLENTLDPISVEFYNASGQRVISQQLTDHTLSLGDLPAGFYSYLIRQDGKAYSGKVIVE